jgi:hypothetical protein
MIAEIDIWRAANLLIRSTAPTPRSRLQKVDLTLERGDREGQVVWMRTVRAIATLPAPPAGPRH